MYGGGAGVEWRVGSGKIVNFQAGLFAQRGDYGDEGDESFSVVPDLSVSIGKRW